MSSIACGYNVPNEIPRSASVGAFELRASHRHQSVFIHPKDRVITQHLPVCTMLHHEALPSGAIDMRR